MDTVRPMDLPNLDTAAERLRWSRARKRLSRPALAERTGISKNTIAKDETGERGFDGDRAEPYGRALGVPWLWLLFGRKGLARAHAPDEVTLLEYYRRLSEQGKDALMRVAESLPSEAEPYDAGVPAKARR